MLAPQALLDLARMLLAQPARRDTLEPVDHRRYRETGRVVHKQMHMIGLAVELAQLGAQAGAGGRMRCSQVLSISPVKARRLYLVTNTRCACRV